jgi:hypothetical protein
MKRTALYSVMLMLLTVSIKTYSRNLILKIIVLHLEKSWLERQPLPVRTRISTM